MSHAIVVDDLHSSWPAGPTLFDGLSFTVGPGRTGLVGANGSGKSTLLRLVAGDLRPAGGSAQVAGRLGYLRQDLTLDTGRAVTRCSGSPGPAGAAGDRARPGRRGPVRRRRRRLGRRGARPGHPGAARPRPPRPGPAGRRGLGR